MRKFICVAIFLIGILTMPVLLSQGTTGSISGTVMDETGGVIPGVTVTVANLDTGASRVLVTIKK